MGGRERQTERETERESEREREREREKRREKNREKERVERMIAATYIRVDWLMFAHSTSRLRIPLSFLGMP